jgi:endonuclease-3 related protein
MAGAVLVQHASWTGASRAVAALRTRGLLSPGLLLRARRLDALLRPAGLHRVKARRLRALSRWVLARPDAASLPTPSLREELLAVDGVGPETADSILLYAFGRPVFVVDAYARRVLERHGVPWARAPYEEVRRRAEAALPRKAPYLNEAHALLVEAGKRHCGPVPRCAGCPLEPYLPARGPKKNPPGPFRDPGELKASFVTAGSRGSPPS